MEGEISSILISVREKYRNINTYHMKQHPCCLKNITADALELVLESESDIPGVGSNGKQVCVPYSNLFNPLYCKTKLKPAADRKTIFIQGEAAVGKTVLCMSIVEDWASGMLFREFQIVLLLPLSSRNVALASSLSGLLNVLYTDFKADTCSKLASYLKRNQQHNVLIIADGWEELQTSQCQTGSFLYSLLFSNDIIPTSSVTVLITSRPDCVQMNDFLQSVDRLITLTGFDRKAIGSLVQSEFASDFKRVRYLTAQLNENPLVESICSIPLNFAIVCHQCQSIDAEPLPSTITDFYLKLIWTLASASIRSNAPHESSLSSHHDLPEELQQSWWQVCELAFQNIEKGHNTYSPSDATVFILPELKKISYFGLIKPIAESGSDSLSFSFLHPHFEEYLAALHLAKQPQEAQLKFMRELVAGAECKTTINFWHFFITNYTRVVLNVNPDIVIQVLKILSTANKQKYCMDLCHLSYEAKNNVVNQKVVEALSLVDTRVLRFGHSQNVYDCTSMVYVLQNVTQECKVEINFQDCNLQPEHLNHLANALHEKSGIVQVRGLNLSGNKLNSSLVVDFFSKPAAALKSLKILILRKCDFGTTIDIKAILSALTESASQTLTHLDLSFNPISISFLQTLQKHIESYATFESLQNLGLKGSLKHDVTTRFLVNFSDTLSCRCKSLRRLDLSDNNLGEPGNPDLNKIISQLLSLGRDFNLCLNEEYMSKVDNEFICIMEESIKKKGTINHTIAHGVIVGPGRSGKNSLMSRLMGNGPPEPDAISPSTGVLENIVKVEVKKLSTVATAVSNLEWKKLKYDEEALELIMTTARDPSVTTTVSKQDEAKYIIKEHTESSVTTNAKSSLPSKTLMGPEQRKKYKLIKFFKKLKRLKPRKSDQTSAKDKDKEKVKSAILYMPDVERVDIFKRAVKLRGMDALREHLESSWSLYLTNTGGQIEFQEHLPLLVCGPSIFFITFSLNHDIEKPYDVRYEYPDGRVETYKSPATLLQELLQTLATISASNFISGQHNSSESGIKPKIFFVGTHKDCLQPKNNAEKIIQRKDKLLQSCIRQTTLFDQGSIQFAEHPKRLIFAVNNLSGDDDEFQKIRTAVQMSVEKDDFTIECPSSWLILSLILREKHKSDQVLTFDECFSIARECGITDCKELKEALSFIHSRLGLVRYFNVEDLNTLVIIDPQVLFDRMTDLIVKTFTIENVDAKEIEEFCQRGIIPVAVMQKISNKSSSDSKLTFTWLTKLLNYLRIAAFFADKDGDKYFFPSALCHAPESHSYVTSPSESQPPLLVGFKSGFCPRGIPGALIKYLMTNEMKSRRSWNIIPNKIFRNEVSFAIQAHGNITLRILPTHLDISYFSEADSTGAASEEDSNKDELMKKTCEIAYLQIEKGMSTVTSQCMECNYFFGFYCTLGTCQAHKHPAQLEWDGRNPFKLVCKVENKRGNLPKNFKIWNLQKRRKPGKAQLDKEIDADGHGVLKHLGQIADSMSEWEGRISEELGLKPADVASIYTKHPRSLNLQSREALHLWKQKLGSAATYQKLIDIFECAGYCNYAEIVKNLIYDAESEEDDASDYEEPISQPETYPHLKPSPLLSPKFTNRRISSCDEYLLVNQANAQNLPEGDVYNQKVLDSHDVSVVPTLSSKHKPTTTTSPVPSSKSDTTPNYPIYVGKYDFEPLNDAELGFKKGDLMYIINSDEAWWYARSKESGKGGYIPSNYVALVSQADEWEIDGRQIVIFKKLCDGWYCEIWEGLWNGTTPVAITTPIPGTIAIRDSLQTANLMKKIHHQNIIQLYGVCTMEDTAYIVTEFMKHNSLVEYLHGEGRALKFPQLIDMAAQVAAGMAYLEKQNIVHRDLAARSIRVGENLICKVANFEMAQIIDEDIYELPTGTKYPLKWTAVETVLYNRLTIRSDIWSFGILLYEIITYGLFPYPDMGNDEVIIKLKQGYRMPRRPECPDKLYNIMLACWQEDPANRPIFETLQQLLEEFFVTEDGPSREAFEEWEIDRRRIVLVRKLMSSEFIEVWEGLWNHTAVTVKTPKQGKIAIDDFLQTADLMKKLRHRNIIQLYALCTKEEPMYIVTEFMKQNSLLDYLCSKGRALKLPQLIDMASQVAAGMAYLEKQNIIHRDLAARNILVGENLLCKVANFEMARVVDADIYEADTGEKVSIRWTAPEAAFYNRWSIKSDVWSFGILLYEVITYGCSPYSDMSNTQVLEAVEKGYCMPRPMECPDKLYNIMFICWQEKPENRPLFEALQWQLQEILYK